MTLQYPVTVTLEVSTLLSTYCTLLARAALLRIERAESDAYWSSECGRIRSDAMWCGEQDADAEQRGRAKVRQIVDRLEGMTAKAMHHEAAAAAIGAAIKAAGYSLPRVEHHELTQSELLTTVIQHDSWIAEIRAELRETVTDGLLPVRPTVFDR